MATPSNSVLRVGVVGAGQLAHMMGEEAHNHNVHLTVLATSPDDAAAATADALLLGDPTDFDALQRLADDVDFVTFDHELIDLEQLKELERSGVDLRPSAATLRFAVDKAFQRRAFATAGLPVPRFLVLPDNEDALDGFLASLTAPPVIKAARGGYDGRGVVFPATFAEARDSIDEFAQRGKVVVEERLQLVAEAAQLAVGGIDGSLALYPLVTTVQANGMCVEVDYPSHLAPELHELARHLTESIADLIDLVGTLAVEYFVTANGLLINELALRPHNSGHWTIEGCATSQFANHLRAVSGQTLGPTTCVVDCAVMVNVVGGDEPANAAAAQQLPSVAVHDYGKAWRPGRKLGHVTAVGDDVNEVRVRAWDGARAYGTSTRENI